MALHKVKFSLFFIKMFSILSFRVLLKNSTTDASHFFLITPKNVFFYREILIFTSNQYERWRRTVKYVFSLLKCASVITLFGENTQHAEKSNHIKWGMNEARRESKKIWKKLSQTFTWIFQRATLVVKKLGEENFFFWIAWWSIKFKLLQIFFNSNF